MPEQVISYEAVLGFVVIALIAIVGLFISLRKAIIEDKKPIDLLNENIIRLNENIKNMAKSDDIRDRRITKHGEEIDELKNKVAVHEEQIKDLKERN